MQRSKEPAFSGGLFVVSRRYERVLTRDPTREIPVVVVVVSMREANIARQRMTELAQLGKSEWERASRALTRFRGLVARKSRNRQGRGSMPSYRDIAKMIDHSLLAPTMLLSDFEAGIRLALEYDVASVCLMPFYLPRCVELLAGSDVKSSTVIGFPHGGNTTATKVAESRIALEQGAAELDMVINVNRALSGDWDYVRTDIAAVLNETHGRGQKLKVIFENCYLNDEQKIRLCEICGELGVDWVKTSTGFGTSGATLDDLRLMRKYSPPNVQVKASGGVRELDFVLAAREIGVTRCGSSRTREMLDAAKTKLS